MIGDLKGAEPGASRAPLLGVKEKRLLAAGLATVFGVTAPPAAKLGVLMPVNPPKPPGVPMGKGSGARASSLSVGTELCVRCEAAFGALCDGLRGAGAGMLLSGFSLAVTGAIAPSVAAPSPVDVGREKALKAGGGAAGAGAAEPKLSAGAIAFAVDEGAALSPPKAEPGSLGAPKPPALLAGAAAGAAVLETEASDGGTPGVGAVAEPHGDTAGAALGARRAAISVPSSAGDGACNAPAGVLSPIERRGGPSPDCASAERQQAPLAVAPSAPGAAAESRPAGVTADLLSGCGSRLSGGRD